MRTDIALHTRADIIGAILVLPPGASDDDAIRAALRVDSTVSAAVHRHRDDPPVLSVESSDEDVVSVRLEAGNDAGTEPKACGRCQRRCWPRGDGGRDSVVG